jgi:hypothetical protein
MGDRSRAWKGQPDAEGGKPNIGAADNKRAVHHQPSGQARLLPPTDHPYADLTGSTIR